MYILNHCSPNDFGYFQNIFTARILIEIVKKLWDIEVCNQTIYNFLHKNELSYQRGHNDYEDASPAEQRAYVEELFQTLKNDDLGVKKIFFDESIPEQEFVPEVVGLLNECGAQDYASKRATDYSNFALSHLEGANPVGDAGQALHELTHLLLGRKS